MNIYCIVDHAHGGMKILPEVQLDGQWHNFDISSES
jgi:hypothetical protein